MRVPLLAAPLRGPRRTLVAAVLGALVPLAGCGPTTIVCGLGMDGCTFMDPDGTRLRVRSPLSEPFQLPAGGESALDLVVDPPIGEDPPAPRRISVDAPWPLQAHPLPSQIRGRSEVRIVLWAPEDALEWMDADLDGSVVPVQIAAWQGSRQVGSAFFDVRVLPPR